MNMKRDLFILFLTLTTCCALAADRYLVSGGTGNWNSTTNWSATDGGASGASFPVAGDNVYFTTLSANAPMTVNVTSACATLTCSGTYAGTFTVNGLLQLTGNITLLSTMTITTTSGSPELRINAGGVTFTSNGKQWNLPLKINIATATVTFADDWYVSNFTCGITTGVTTINGNKIYVGGNATNNITSGYVTGTTELVMNGTGTLSMPNVTTGSWRNNITINTAGTVTISGTLSLTNMTLTYTAGTVVTTGSTINTSGSVNFDCGGIILNNWTMSINNTITLKSEVKIAGTFTNETPVTTAIIQSDIPGTRRKITMLSGSNNTLTTVTATDVNSSEGLPVISNATLTNCLNWYTARKKLTQFLF